MAEKFIVNAKEHKVQDGDSIESLAKAAGITWQELAIFNWGTAKPEEVNKCLRNQVGCLKRTDDDKNYRFSSEDDPGIVYIPEKAVEKSLATGNLHTIKVKAVSPKKYTPADCYVKFRPAASWNGEYGFDWMREADFPIMIQGNSIFADEKFEDIVGFQKKSKIVKGKEVWEVVTDGNAYNGTFFKDEKLYGKLQDEYKQKKVAFTKNDKDLPITGYISYLNIFNNESEFKLPRQVKIQAFVEVKQAPEQLIFKYDKKYFKISPEILPNSTKKEEITIECIKALEKEQIIEVRSIFRDEKSESHEVVVGRLMVMANSKAKRKVVKTLVVAVKTPSVSPNGEQTGDSKGTLPFIRRILRQALIEPQVEEESIDVSTDQTFIDNYISGTFLIDTGAVTKVDLSNYCNYKLRLKLFNQDPKLMDKYAHHLKAFYFMEQHKDGLYGYSLGDQVACFSDAVESTAVHEWLHSLGLPHTFDGHSSNSKFCYQYPKTENIMDYTHHLATDGTNQHYKKARISLYKWQWEVARSHKLVIKEP